MEWLDFELPLEKAVYLEQHLRHIDVLPEAELRKTAKMVVNSWHHQKNLLSQAMKRLAEVDCVAMQRQTDPFEHQPAE